MSNPNQVQSYYFAANQYEGCGHEHKTQETAARCARSLNSKVRTADRVGYVPGYRGGLFKVYHRQTDEMSIDTSYPPKGDSLNTGS